MTSSVSIAQPQIGVAEREAVERVLRTGALSQGAEVAAFETEFADLVAGRPCVAVNSGTSALHLGLLAAGVGPGDEIIVPSFTFAATANAVALTGATPVFADIDPETFCLDPSAVAAVLSPRTAGILPVHLFGQPADMSELTRLAAAHGLAVFEDACQAHGSALFDRPAGSFGAAAAFSFYPTKNMTTGEGGMVVCADEDIARRVRLLRNQGMQQRYANEIVGFNARMTDMAAAMGRVQLGRLPEFTHRRQQNAEALDASLRGVVLPTVRRGATHVYHQYTVRSDRRDELVEHLARRGIGTGVYYPTPVHRLPAFNSAADLPETDRACAEVVSLPVHPGVEAADLERVVAAVNELTRTLEVAS